MNRKRIIFLIGFVAMGLFLAACGAPPPTPKVNDAAGTEIVATFMAQITQTAAAAGTPTPTESAAVQEETEEPDIFDELETAEASVDLDETPTPGPYQSLLSRFRFVTVIGGNLFVRDGMGLPKQITQSGQDHDPVISADGQKIVFYRGEKFDNVFVVNADGSGEKSIINNKLLPLLEKGDVKFITFQQGTNNLFFNTYACQTPLSFCTIGVFFLNAESATFMRFAGGLSGSKNQGINFFEAPNRQYLSLADFDHLDLFSINGKLVQPDIIKASSSTDWLAKTYWLPDSSGLIAIASTGIWRYTLKDHQAEKIALDFEPVFDEISCYLSISPDRNWIFYQDHQQKKRLGNLTDAQTQVYAWGSDCVLKWSADSQHFASQIEIGSVDGTPPIKIDDGHFIAWLDATHYLFSKGKSIIELQTYIAEVGKESAATQVDFLWSPVYAVLEPTPAP